MPACFNFTQNAPLLLYVLCTTPAHLACAYDMVFQCGSNPCYRVQCSTTAASKQFHARCNARYTELRHECTPWQIPRSIYAFFNRSLQSSTHVWVALCCSRVHIMHYAQPCGCCPAVVSTSLRPHTPFCSGHPTISIHLSLHLELKPNEQAALAMAKLRADPIS